MNKNITLLKMLVEPTLISLLAGTLIVSSLSTSTYANISKTYSYDEEAKRLSMYSGIVGFCALFLALAGLVYAKIYGRSQRFVIGVFAFVWVIVLALMILTFLVWDNLYNSHHLPVATKHVLNTTEMKTMFIAFCISLSCVAAGLTFVFTHGIEGEFFDDITGNAFDFKGKWSNMFRKVEKSKEGKNNNNDIFKQFDKLDDLDLY